MSKASQAIAAWWQSAHCERDELQEMCDAEKRDPYGWTRDYIRGKLDQLQTTIACLEKIMVMEGQHD